MEGPGQGRPGAGRPRAAQAPLSSVCLSVSGVQVHLLLPLGEMGLAAQPSHYCGDRQECPDAAPQTLAGAAPPSWCSGPPQPGGPQGPQSHSAQISDPGESCTLLRGSTSAPRSPLEGFGVKGQRRRPTYPGTQPRTWHRGPLWAESWLWPQSPSFLLPWTAHGALPAPSVRVFLCRKWH